MPPMRTRKNNNGRFGLSRSSVSSGQKSKNPSAEFDLEQARQEVFNLGIKGFSVKDKRTAKRELAIRLGAIPKKPRGKNIKQHLEAIREQKRKEKEEREQMQEKAPFLKSTKKSSSSAKNHPGPKKKGLNEVRGMDYQLGRFKDGVQYLSKEDIKRIETKRR